MSNNNILSMLEDKSGNLWFGTGGGGVNKYDGETFTHFTTKEGLSHLSYNIVWSILEDKSGNLWFGTYGCSVNKYDGKTFTHFTLKDGMINNSIMSILEDKSGNLWFCTDGDGVYKYVHDAIGTGGDFSLRSEHFTTKQGMSSNIVWSILEDKSGCLWFGTDGGGVNKYDGETFTHFTTKEGMSHSSVMSILEDRSGNLWFGTDEGVNKYDGETFTHFTTNEGLSNNKIISILEDRSGNLWFGTGGLGVNKYDGETFTHFTTKEGLSHNAIWSILEDKSGNLWFGTSEGGVNKYDGETFTHYTTKEGLSHNNILSILEDRSGNLWFGTYGGGVNKYDDQTFTHFSTKEGLSNNQASSLIEDNAGNIWVGTYGGGVCVLYEGGRVKVGEKTKEDSVEYEWEYINTENGLTNDDVLSLVFDAEGYVWAGTNKGINKINAESFEVVRSYTKLEGFRGIECNQNSSYLDSKGNLWFGTATHLTKYNPQADWQNKLEPQTHIKSIKLFFEIVDWRIKDSIADIEFDGVMKGYPLPKDLVLSYDKNHLTFEYIGISLKIPEKVRYQFILEGLDKDWSPVTKKREITYTNLTPGDYVFKVKACNDEGVWNKEPTTYPFRIKQPYWEMWWFYLGQILFFVLLIGGTLIVSRAGKNQTIITVLVFICLFIIFEFIQNLCEPFYEEYVGSTPIVKTLLNLILISILLPAHTFLRRYLIGRKKKKIDKKLEELI